MSDPENQGEARVPTPADETSASTSTTKEESRSTRGATRRRGVLWGLIVVLIGVALGATVGWSSQVPIYQSEGLIYIEPSMPTPADPGGRDVLPRFEGFVAGQVQMLHTRRVAELAMRTEIWQETGEAFGPMAVEHFVARRTIVHARGTQHIAVQFRDPRAEIAQAGVRALIEAYQQTAKELNDADERLNSARAYVETLNAKTRDATEKLLMLTRDYGGLEGLKVRHVDAVQQVLSTEKELHRILAQIRMREAADVDSGVNQEMNAEEIALESAQMAEYLLQLEMLKAEGELLAAKLDAAHEKVQAIRARARALESRIEEYAKAWNERRAQKANDQTLEQLKEAAQALERRMSALRAVSRRIGETRANVERTEAERDDLSRQLDPMKALRDQLENQLQGTGRIKIYNAGSLPTGPYQDRRMRFAIIGGVVGGLGALLVVLLFTFVWRRAGRAADASAYHAKVRASVELLPKRIGEWKAHDVALPAGAAKLPKPNVAMGREFQNPSTGENATLRIVQCKDARDLSAYYPPIQYPAEGWTLREAEPRHLPALLAAIPGTVYRFTKESSDGSSEVLVYNFFARPDGSIESGPAGALTAAAETHTQALGAAQFQILLGPSMTRDRRDEVFRTLIAAALPVMDALCIEDDA